MRDVELVIPGTYVQIFRFVTSLGGQWWSSSYQMGDRGSWPCGELVAQLCNALDLFSYNPRILSRPNQMRRMSVVQKKTYAYWFLLAWQIKAHNQYKSLASMWNPDDVPENSRKRQGIGEGSPDILLKTSQPQTQKCCRNPSCVLKPRAKHSLLSRHLMYCPLWIFCTRTISSRY